MAPLQKIYQQVNRLELTAARFKIGEHGSTRAQQALVRRAEAYIERLKETVGTFGKGWRGLVEVEEDRIPSVSGMITRFKSAEEAKTRAMEYQWVAYEARTQMIRLSKIYVAAAQNSDIGAADSILPDMALLRDQFKKNMVRAIQFDERRMSLLFIKQDKRGFRHLLIKEGGLNFKRIVEHEGDEESDSLYFPSWVVNQFTDDTYAQAQEQFCLAYRAHMDAKKELKKRRRDDTEEADDAPHHKRTRRTNLQPKSRLHMLINHPGVISTKVIKSRSQVQKYLKRLHAMGRLSFAMNMDIWHEAAGMPLPTSYGHGLGQITEVTRKATPADLQKKDHRSQNSAN
ncbi:hypothetical protein EJ06DRAFT_569188 [Trichodelitschia bisporula]|uniref:Uncharacterized protein n=1 Tax=Trichodelitschia bisporula TaxID=703511 RepID=A0A6G1I9F0_9PEZI|nr:hypothetical protein EJ06DRAFT_569188 [Trichodelitschia bisporula]